MIVQRLGRLAILASVVLLLAGGLTGCDYWPPALQSQIEQLRTEVQIAAAEKTRLESQVKEAIKSRDELQLKMDDMARINRELTTRVTSLEQGLAAEREKVAKASRPGPKTMKTAAKKSATPQAKKKKPAAVTAKKGR
jgi:outer membrane murein-binding lipoprotein Lpp